MDKEFKSISLKVTTLDRIQKYGVFGDSKDDVINKILDKLEKKTEKKVDNKIK